MRGVFNDAYVIFLSDFFFIIKSYVVDTNLNCLDKSIKAYVVGTHLNCLDMSRQFK